MAETKKRTSDSDGSTQIKKPKFEKKSIPKGVAGGKANKSGNPFKKPGNVKTRFFFVFR